MPAAPLLPASWHRQAMVTALACWVLAALLGAWYAGDHRAGAFDDAVARGIHSVIGEQSMVARVLSGPTHPIVVYPVIALTIGVAVFRRWWAGAALAVAAPGVCVLLTELLFKPLFGRTHEGVYSYPSGHTVSAVATLAVAGLVVSVDWPVRWRLALGWLFLLAYVVLAVGLVGMDYHYFTDTVGGLLVAVGGTLPLTVLADRLTPHPAAAAPGSARTSATSR